MPSKYMAAKNVTIPKASVIQAKLDSAEKTKISLISVGVPDLVAAARSAVPNIEREYGTGQI